ncbi:transketolase [candidate division KSB1 bacterium]|nr:transketolase [candidate division KSB1 bacterium]
MASGLDDLCINTIRMLSVDGVQKAKSGHPGLPLGCAAMAYAVWTRHLRHNPADPKWVNRDRFVLSAGHGSMLLYSMLHLTGYDLPMEQIQAFRQWESKTPGHPESNLTPGVEATTGPLGQGVGNIVGMAIARENLAATFNRSDRELIDYRIFGICSDGDLMEGVSAEAASIAGHLGLGSITLLYDDNRITIDGSTEISFTEDVMKRFEAYGWHVLECDGLDVEAVDAAVQAGVRETTRPTLIRCRTTIGYGSPNKAGTSKVHGAPLGDEEVVLTKRNLGWPEDRSFHVPNEAFKHFGAALTSGKQRQEDWNTRLSAARADAAWSARWDAFWRRELPAGWTSRLPRWTAADKPLATRKASEKCMHSLAAILPNMIGGSADLVESNLTYLEGQGDFQKGVYAGRNIRFGIREHGMGAILNGIALSAPYIPFGATFLCFLDYLKPAVRVAAISDLPVIYVFTHDSIGLGEDGPTHQPVEHLSHMRATPNLFVFRPGDANETTLCWQLAIERTHGPSTLILTRQNLPILDPAIYGELKVDRGGYILAEASGADPEVVLMASGSEVSLALNTRLKLEVEGIPTRVVSMPCLEIFDLQSPAYREQVLPPRVRARLAIEAGATCGWWKYAGLDGDVIGLDRFGASAPAELLFEKFGFTAEHVYQRALAVRQRAKRSAEAVA